MTKWPQKNASWLGLLLSSSIIICYRSRKWKCVIDRFENIHPSLLAPAWSNTGERDSGSCSTSTKMVLDTVDWTDEIQLQAGRRRFRISLLGCQTCQKNLWKVLLGVAVVQGCWNFFVWLPDAVATCVILYISTSWSTIWGIKVISWLLLMSFLERDKAKKRPKQRHEKSHFCSEPMVVITTVLYLVIICRQRNVWLASLKWKRFMLVQYTTVSKNRMCCVCVRENGRKPGQMRENAISYCVYTSLCLCACVWLRWLTFLSELSMLYPFTVLTATA